MEAEKKDTDVIDLTNESVCIFGKNEVARIYCAKNLREGLTEKKAVHSLVDSWKKIPVFTPSNDLLIKADLPKPILGICKHQENHRLQLVWHFGNCETPTNVMGYELWFSSERKPKWKKVDFLEALPPPMSSNLNNIESDIVHFFAVRAIDTEERIGPFSTPCSALMTSVPGKSSCD